MRKIQARVHTNLRWIVASLLLSVNWAFAESASQLTVVQNQDQESVVMQRTVTENELMSGLQIRTSDAETSALNLPGGVTIMVAPGSELIVSGDIDSGIPHVQLSDGMCRLDAIESPVKIQLAGRLVALDKGAAVAQLTDTGEGRFALVYGTASVGSSQNGDSGMRSIDTIDLSMDKAGEFALWQGDGSDVTGPFGTQASDLDREFVSFRRLASSEIAVASIGDDGEDIDSSGDVIREIQNSDESVPSFGGRNASSTFGIGESIAKPSYLELDYSESDATRYYSSRYSVSVDTQPRVPAQVTTPILQSTLQIVTADRTLTSAIEDSASGSALPVNPQEFGESVGLIFSNGNGTMIGDLTDCCNAGVFFGNPSDTFPNAIMWAPTTSFGPLLFDNKYSIRELTSLNEASGTYIGDSVDSVFRISNDGSYLTRLPSSPTPSSRIEHVTASSWVPGDQGSLSGRFYDLPSKNQALSLELQRMYWEFQAGFDSTGGYLFDPRQSDQNGVIVDDGSYISRFELVDRFNQESNAGNELYLARAIYFTEGGTDEMIPAGTKITLELANKLKDTGINIGRSEIFLATADHPFSLVPNDYISSLNSEFNIDSSSEQYLQAASVVYALTQKHPELSLSDYAGPYRRWLECGVDNELDICFSGADAVHDVQPDFELDMPLFGDKASLDLMTLSAGFRSSPDLFGSESVGVLSDRDHFSFLHFASSEGNETPTQLLFASGAVNSRARDIAIPEAGGVDALQNPQDFDDFQPIVPASPQLHRFYLSAGLWDYAPFEGTVGSGIRGFIPIGGLPNSGSNSFGELYDSGLLVINNGRQVSSNEIASALHADLHVTGERKDQTSAWSVSLGQVTYSEVTLTPNHDDGFNFEDPNVQGANVNAEVNASITSVGSQRSGIGTSVVSENSTHSTAFGGGKVPRQTSAGVVEGYVESVPVGYASFLVFENYEDAQSSQTDQPQGRIGAIGGGESSQFVATRLATATGREAISRSTAQISGFATAISEYEVAGGSSVSMVSTGSNGTGLSLSLNDDENSAQGNIKLNRNVFADGTRTQETEVVTIELDHHGAFIDNHRFAARTVGSGETQAVQENEVALVSIETFRGTAESHTPSETLPLKIDTGLTGEATQNIDKYEHVTWGLFLGDIATSNTEREHVHMGTWVAGKKADLADLPESGMATYSGHAIGNVRSGNAQYTSVGSYENKWDFGGPGGGQGDLTIKFDGQQYTGVARAESESVTFDGNIGNADNSRVGSVAGAFYGGPANDDQQPLGSNLSQGGQFEISNYIPGGDSNYVATGTFAADVKPE